MTLGTSSPIKQGDRVLHADHPEHGFGTVKFIDTDPLEGSDLYSVAFDWQTGNENCSHEQLSLVPAVTTGEWVKPGHCGGADELRQRLGAALVFAENSASGAFLRSFVTPLPHQAFLLDKIHSQHRFGHLIADDVGMGKTIEAGLLIASLLQENPRARVLILAPKGLILQWQDEMEEHFNLVFSVAGRDFATKKASMWDTVGLTVASIDALKQERYRDLLKEVAQFDLVICDEAHRLTARREFLSNDLYRTQSYRFMEWLSSEGIVSWEATPEGAPRSPRLLLLTATPHQGDDLRFAYLLRLARPDLIDPDGGNPLPDDDRILREVLTRTSKERAVDWEGKSIFKGHETRTLDIQLSEEEEAVLGKLTWYVQNKMVLKSSGKSDALVRTLAMHTYQKIAASSWRALERSLCSRLDGRQPDEDETGDTSATEFEFVGGDDERAAIGEVLDLIAEIPEGSKVKCFKDLILGDSGFRAEDEKVLVFTQYRETQEFLLELLESAGLRVALIHGGLSLDERKQQRAFFEDEADVMISTEAGSEGANLQRKCHLMVTYDLSWNPMRMLQRIGRLDRFGQKHVVHVVNLRLPKSWDAMVSEKIETKLDVAEGTLSRVACEDYRAMIMGEIHESIDVQKLMAESDWGADQVKLDRHIGEEVEKVLENKKRYERLFQGALGMPESFKNSNPEMGPDVFREAFAWAAGAHDIKLKETRTSENQFLSGIYHFTLPPAFRVGLRPSRECYLVFDRERFAEVRGEVLGRARGQDIKPTLAGFGDPVTDWFFRSALSADKNGTHFQLKRPDSFDGGETWWIVTLAAWRKTTPWRGPDKVFVHAIDRSGMVLREVPAKEIFSQLTTAAPNWQTDSNQIPSLELTMVQVREDLKKRLESISNLDRSTLSLTPWMAIQWSNASPQDP